MRRNRGFTLVELLVVIGVIAVLVGLLFPVISGARDSAKKVQCASNLRTLGQAMIAYGSDNDRKVPMHPSTDLFLWDIGWGTRDAVLKYGANRKSFYCPMVDRETDDKYWNFAVNKTVTGYWFLNKRLRAPGQNPGADELASPQFEFKGDIVQKPHKKKLREAFDQPRAGELELVTDATMSTGTGVGRKFTGLSTDPTVLYNQTSHLTPDKKKAEGGNILYMDGRVDWKHWREPPIRKTTDPIPDDEMQVRHRPKGRNIDQWF